MNKKEKVQIFIDGGNFHHLVFKKLFIKEIDFAFDKFTNFLVNGRELSNYGKRFYIGTVREREGDDYSKKAMSKQTRLFSVLKKENWQLKTSKLRFRKEKVIIDNRTSNYQELHKKGVKYIEFNRMREKGIDVKIATDIIIGALDNQYDTAIIISSDSDLLPAIDIVRHRFNKRVEYVGFSILDEDIEDNSTRPSQAMIGRTDIQRILVKSDLQAFIKKS